jgi:hypothetical protein
MIEFCEHVSPLKGVEGVMGVKAEDDMLRIVIDV